MKEKIAVIGAGLIGRAWAMVFARAGHAVALYDAQASATAHALDLIRTALADLKAFNLIDDSAETVSARISAAQDLRTALDGAVLAQENTSENLGVKKQIFAEMDRLAAPQAILASSTSTIPTSAFAEELQGRQRCIVAHPVNPPHLVPVVELSPAPFTSPEVVTRARALFESVGQVPVLVKKEIQGFILNRLQAVLLCEAFRLVEDDYVSVDDLDKTLKDGLGLRWAFMGPFETIDLNAPGGVADYANRFGAKLNEIDASAESAPRAWSSASVARIEGARRKVMPQSEHLAREIWRDRRLMALIAHKREMAKKKGA